MTKANKSYFRTARGLFGAGEFRYDPEEDEAYRQYREAYTRLGKRAMEDTVGTVSARTGGLASSYAQTAGQQAQNNYMAQLADKVPQLRQAAYEMYTDRADRAMDRLEYLRKVDEDDYRRRQDAKQEARDRQEYDRAVYEDDRDYNYKVARDAQQAQAERQATQAEAQQDEQEQLRRDIQDYLKQGGTLAGIYQIFGSDALERSGYREGQVRQMESWYKKQNAPKSSSGGTDRDREPGPVDWTQAEQWFALHGQEGLTDWIREHYKQLGFSSVSVAQAAWNNYLRSKS